MPDTDINPNSNVELEADTGATQAGPAEDDAEAMYDPNEIEATRGREQGLGVGARDLQRQRDPGGDAALSQVNRDEMNRVDAIAESDVNDLSVDEEFDEPEEGSARRGEGLSGGPM